MMVRDSRDKVISVLMQIALNITQSMSTREEFGANISKMLLVSLTMMGKSNSGIKKLNIWK